MRYKVAEGWKIKGADGIRYRPGNVVPLPEGDVSRLLELGAVIEDFSDEEVIAENEQISASGGDFSDAEVGGDESSTSKKPQGRHRR
jgi:hypothetical protein